MTCPAAWAGRGPTGGSRPGWRQAKAAPGNLKAEVRTLDGVAEVVTQDPLGGDESGLRQEEV